MEIMEKSLLDMIQQISDGVDSLNIALADKTTEIESLKQEITDLKAKHETTLDQIKIYIKELEQIKASHANSNDHSK